jgi:membrane fusion protein, multidrug efflux system
MQLMVSVFQLERTFVDELSEVSGRTPLGTAVSACVVLGALVTAFLVIRATTSYPRTDAAEIVANVIGMAPMVEGPVIELAVHDNEFVRKGQLLYKLDDRPHLYTLQNALAAQTELEGEIKNESRRIAAQGSAVHVAEASITHSRANEDRAEAEIRAAAAEVQRAIAALQMAKAEESYAENTYRRIEPLLAKQYVTPDDVDRAHTMVDTKTQSTQQAESQLVLANAKLHSSMAQKSQATSLIQQSNAELQQSSDAISLIDPLVAQRERRAAAVRRARYDYENCKIYAPFDARVTNLTIAEGQYIKAGQQLFTLIDTRTWWVMANFRETQLTNIRPGAPVDIYLMSRPERRLEGAVESLGFGVTPDPDVVGKISLGLPDTQRTLNWVRLASRYPVRIRVISPPENQLRIGEVAVVIVRPEQEHRSNN